MRSTRNRVEERDARYADRRPVRPEYTDATEARSLAGINFILGIWLIISPWILNYFTTEARWDQFATGIAIAVLALIRYAIPRASWASWLAGLAGIWMIIAPFILNYTKTAAFWNEIIVGIVVAVLAFANVQTYSRYNRTPA